MTSAADTRRPALEGVAQLRLARPTGRLEAMLAFYRDGLGLTHFGGFTDHDGYDGVMLGMPGSGWHLEFTRHRDGSPAPTPDPDHLLVLYFPDRAVRDVVADRLTGQGHPMVTPENPYWRTRAVQVNDPDGWGVLLVHGEGLAPSGHLPSG